MPETIVVGEDPRLLNLPDLPIKVAPEPLPTTKQKRKKKGCGCEREIGNRGEDAGKVEP